MKWKDTEGFIARIKDEERFGIFLDTGFGKTSLNLALIDYKFFAKDYKKILIITPKEVSLSTWQREIDKWKNFKYLKPVVQLINDTPKKRKEMLEEVGEYCVHIISSGITEWMTGTYIKKTSKKSGKEYKKFVPNTATPDYDLIIVDECSQFKDVRTRRYKALKKLVRKGLLLLSGTPFSNVREEVDKKTGAIYYVNADEMYYIFSLLELYKRSLTDFRNDFCYTLPWDKYNYRMHKETFDTLTEVMHEHSISKKLDLKISKNQFKVYCESDELRMKTLADEYYLETQGDEELMVLNKANMINKSLQLANGFVYDETGDIFRINTYKFERLKGLLSVIKDNVILLYPFKEDKNFLLKNLPDAVLYEGTEQEDAWNRGEIKIMILSPFSQKYGLNLQDGGHTLIWYGLVWSGESYKQTNARLYRRGQNQDVDVFYLLGKYTYDDYVYDMLVSKIKVLDDFIDYTQKI
jgi:hypothetical protein